MLQNAVSYQTLMAVLLPACLAASPGASPCQATTTYTGEAFGASLNVLILKTTISDTGPLPRSGGSLSTQLASIDVPGVLDAGLLSESTTGGSSRASSQSSVANVAVTAAGIGVTASVLTSNATAQACGGGSPSVAGGSNIANLMVNGIPITVTGAPNQTIPLIVGSLIINEQISAITSASCGASASLVVNALHLKVPGIADVVVSSSNAGVNCTPPQNSSN